MYRNANICAEVSFGELDFDYTITFRTLSTGSGKCYICLLLGIQVHLLCFILALPNEDYEDVVINVTLSQIEPRGCVLVPIIPDDIPEDNESFTVYIVGVSSRIDVNIQPDNVTVFIGGIIQCAVCYAYRRCY